jgi:hypothetical protein
MKTITTAFLGSLCNVYLVSPYKLPQVNYASQKYTDPLAKEREVIPQRDGQKNSSAVVGIQGL